MNILAVNTSDDMLSVALNRDDQITHDQLRAERNHNESVLALIDKLLTEADFRLNQLDAVAFGVGPGSFTGLRIAAGVAQGIAFGVQVPTVPVSCMAAIAQKQAGGKVLVAMDARHSKVYWGRYVRNAEGWMELDGEEQLTSIAELSVPGDGWSGAGSGWDRYSDEILAVSRIRVQGWDEEQKPHAAEIAHLGAVELAKGQGRDAELAIPSYHSPYFSA